MVSSTSGQCQRWHRVVLPHVMPHPHSAGQRTAAILLLLMLRQRARRMIHDLSCCPTQLPQHALLSACWPRDRRVLHLPAGVSGLPRAESPLLWMGSPLFAWLASMELPPMPMPAPRACQTSCLLHALLHCTWCSATSPTDILHCFKVECDLTVLDKAPQDLMAFTHVCNTSS